MKKSLTMIVLSLIAIVAWSFVGSQLLSAAGVGYWQMPGESIGNRTLTANNGAVALFESGSSVDIRGKISLAGATVDGLSSCGVTFASVTSTGAGIFDAGTTDVNSVVYGNSTIPLAWYDAGNMCVGIDKASCTSGVEVTGRVAASTYVSAGSYVAATTYVSAGGALIGDGLTTDTDSMCYGNGLVPVWFVDASTLELGVGNTAPTAKLDVTGSGKFSTTLAVGTALTVNGSTADVDSIVYGNSTVPLTYWDAGTMRLGINDATPSYTLDVNGTGRFVGAVTLDSTLAVTTSATIASGFVPYSLGYGTTATVVDSQTVAATLSTITLGSALPDAAGAIEVVCGGTWSGTAGTKTLTVLGGATVLCTLTSASADVGDWIMSAQVYVVGATGATVKANCRLEFSTDDQAEIDTATTTLDVDKVTVYTVKGLEASTADLGTKEVCSWRRIK